MRGQSRGLEKVRQNISDGISLVQIANTALSNINDPFLIRLRELAVQAAKDTLMDEDRRKIQLEVIEIKNGINQINNDIEFNTIPLLNRTSGDGGVGVIKVINGS